jgi:hypothetical protein
MAKIKKVFLEANGSSTYSAAEVAEISSAMANLTKTTTAAEKLKFLQRAGIIDKHGKLAKEYGG